MKLNLSFSPCPNDTFMFDALVNGKIHSTSFLFNTSLHDIEILNQQVIQGIPDISKISTALYPQVADQYQILNTGAALGNNNGPVLISQKAIDASNYSNIKIAIPGVHTTANLLLSIAFPEINNKTEVLFSNIESELLSHRFDAGLIIHESRFTYLQKGLKKIVDLGEYWQQTFNQLVPLGLIVIRRNMACEIKKEIDRLIGASVQYALDHPSESIDYVRMNAKEMDYEVMQKHIALYVNQHSVNIGNEGREAIQFLYQKGQERGLINKIEQNNWFV